MKAYILKVNAHISVFHHIIRNTLQVVVGSHDIAKGQRLDVKEYIKVSMICRPIIKIKINNDFIRRDVKMSMSDKKLNSLSFLLPPPPSKLK